MKDADLRRLITEGARQLEAQQVPALADEAIDRLQHFLMLLQRWNRVYNLTAIRQPQQMVAQHLLDSIVLTRWLPERSQQGISPSHRADNISPDEISTDNTRQVDLLDIGSGAGLPVLPLAICKPDWQFLSVESNGKKARFQQQVLIELGLNNVQIEQRRIETVSQASRWITSRAFAAPEDFMAVAMPLCLPDTRLLLMLGKAQRMPDPVPAPFVLDELVPVHIPGVKSDRHIALCRVI